MIDRRTSLFVRSGLPVPDPHAGALTVGLSARWRLVREGDLFFVWGHVVAAKDRPRICWLPDLPHGSVRRCISKVVLGVAKRNVRWGRYRAQRPGPQDSRQGVIIPERSGASFDRTGAEQG